MGDDFSTLFEFLPIGAYRTLPDGRQIRANPALVHQSRYQTEAELLHAVHDIGVEWYVQPTRRAEFRALLESEGRVVGFESEVYRHRTRERIWVSENAHLVRDAQGRVLYYEGTVEEITDRVAAREALRRSQEELRQIIELVPGMVYRVLLLPDGQRQPTFISPGVRQLFGVEPEALMADGKLMHALRHPEDRARVEAETQAANDSGELLQTEYRAVLPNGQQKWLQVISAAAPDDSGERARVGMVFDITAARQAEALRHERDRAATASLAKSQFLSRVSHELRTPLNAILGFAQLLELEPGDGERQRAWTRHVLDSGQHLLALVNDILDLSSAQTGQWPVAAASVPLQALAQDALDMAGAVAREAGVMLFNELPQDTPLVLRADRTRLLQIVSNLLSNAIKYNHRGGWVRLQARADGDMVELAVADNGPGLDATQRTRLFQPFERVGAQHGPVAGTGLGLALSRQLAEAMGGSIDVHSTPGQGARFVVRLPAG